MIEINGMAHVILAVSEWERCRDFYEALLPFLGLKRTFSGQDMIYYVGARTAVGVGRCDRQYAQDRFVQSAAESRRSDEAAVMRKRLSSRARCSAQRCTADTGPRRDRLSAAAAMLSVALLGPVSAAHQPAGCGPLRCARDDKVF